MRMDGKDMDIVDEQLERAKQEKVETEKRAEREKDIEEQRKKENKIDLYFSDIERDGELSLKFEGGVDRPDEWRVKCFIMPESGSVGISSKGPFSECEDASAYFWELYRKHNLNENRIAYIDNEIIEEEKWLKYRRKEIRNEFIGWIAVAGIIGVIAAILASNVFIGIAIGLVIMCIARIGVGVGGEIDNVRIHKRRIEQLNKDKIRTGF